jgi:flagellar motor component MotA
MTTNVKNVNVKNVNVKNVNVKNVKKTIQNVLYIMEKNEKKNNLSDVLEMFLKVLDTCKSRSYENIIKEMCDLVYHLPKKEFIKTNSVSVSMTFYLLQFVAEGKAYMKKIDKLVSIYGKAAQIAREEKSDKKAFKVISTM